MANPYQPAPATGVLFDATGSPPQLGTSMQGVIFPGAQTVVALANGPTLVNGLPPLSSGQAGHAHLTQGGNVCGGIFSPSPNSGSILIDLAASGTAASGHTVTLEIGRLLMPGAVPNVLASVVVTTGTLTLAAGTVDPFTGLTRSSTAWIFFDGTTTITTYSHVGDVLQSVGGTSGQGPSQLLLNCGPFAGGWGYGMMTAFSSTPGYTEVLCAMTQSGP